jgi:hypothetical protein
MDSVKGTEIKLNLIIDLLFDKCYGFDYCENETFIDEYLKNTIV